MSFLKSSLITAAIICSPIVLAETADAKSELKAKLRQFSAFSASFKQNVIDFEGNLIQENKGNFVVKKPNLLHWNTTWPDENLIVSDGQKLWYYEPDLSEVTTYSIDNATANTPMLLIANPESKDWDNYQVTQLSPSEYNILALDNESQVKSLTLSFSNNQINKFVVLDATDQKSEFVLTDIDTVTEPNPILFKFDIPKDVHVQHNQ